MTYDPSIHEIRKVPASDGHMSENPVFATGGILTVEYIDSLLYQDAKTREEREKWLRGDWKDVSLASMPPEAIAELRQKVTEHGRMMLKKMLLSGTYGKFGDTNGIY